MTSKKDYDIFISYRRDGGAQYARILQLMLAQRGFRVFLDYDELKDGLFNEKIKKAIASAPIFMIVLSKNAIDRCVNADDWVGKEISEAVRLKKKILPVNPDGQFDGIHTSAPEIIRTAVSDNQHSEIYFGQALGATIDQMIRDRIEPVTGAKIAGKNVDEDFEAAKLSLARQEAHNRWMKRLALLVSLFVVAAVIAVATLILNQKKNEENARLQQQKLENLRADIANRYSEFRPILRADLTERQLNAIDTLLQRMRRVNDGLWISQTEFSCGQWAAITGEECDATETELPLTGKPFSSIIEVISDSLYEMTGIEFDLPSAEEWRHAASGGKSSSDWRYSGSNDPDSVAWYKANSGGRLHPVINTDKIPNYLDLFNMNGNAAELCNSPATDSSGVECLTICGGDFSSEAKDITNNSFRLMPIDKADTKTGFRIVIRKTDEEI